MHHLNNILLISYYFAPANSVGAKRFSYLSNYLTDCGIAHNVLTIKEKYLTIRDYSLTTKGKIHRTPVIPPYPFSRHKLNRLFKILFTFIDPYIGWVLPATIKGYSLIKKYKTEIVIVSGPPFSSFIIPLLLKFLLKIKYVIDYRDPWVLYKNELSGFLKRITWGMEKKILENASLVIFNTENARLKYNQLLPLTGKKSVVIPNGYLELPGIKAKAFEKNTRVIVYAGNFYGGRTIDFLVQSMLRLSKEGNCVSLHIFGSIHQDDLEKLNHLELPPDLIVEHPRTSYKELTEYLKGADVLYICQGKIHEYSVPYKLIDYLSIRKPVLAATTENSATYNLVKKTNCGETADIDNPDSIYCALKKILENPGIYSFEGAEEYSFNTIADKYIHILNQTFDGTKENQNPVPGFRHT